MASSNTTATNPTPNPIDIDVDKLLDKLLEVKTSKPGKQVNLTEAEIKGLCMAARETFVNQPILLELEAPLKVCGISLFG